MKKQVTEGSGAKDQCCRYKSCRNQRLIEEGDRMAQTKEKRLIIVCRGDGNERSPRPEGNGSKRREVVMITLVVV